MKTWQAVLVAGGMIAVAVHFRPSANAQQSLNLRGQQIENPAMAECILEHHQVGSDDMTAYVIGACQTVVNSQ